MAKPIRVVTWNINSVRLRLPLLRELDADLAPDVLCLQETKCPDEHFPHAGIAELGFRHVAARGMKATSASVSVWTLVSAMPRNTFCRSSHSPGMCSEMICRPPSPVSL